MPMPQPKKGETQKDFIARFMSNELMKKEYPNETQRLAVAYSIWRKSKQMNKINLNYQVDIKEQGFVNGDFIIQGTAINSVITSNNHKFLPEELQKSADTLKGVPLLVDHDNSVKSIKGRVLSGTYNSIEENVDFRAKVMDNEIKELIKDGRLNTVSVGAVVEDIEEEGDLFIPRGIQFKELSLVAVPADSGATFQIALQEAYSQSKLRKELNEDSHLINKMEVKMSEEDTNLETPKEESETEETEETEKTESESEETKTETEETESKESGVTEEKVKSWVVEAMKSFKEADVDEEPKIEPEPEPETEETESETETTESFKIQQSFGSIKGGAFTLVR